MRNLKLKLFNNRVENVVEVISWTILDDLLAYVLFVSALRKSEG